LSPSTFLYQVQNSNTPTTPTTPTGLGIVGTCRNTVLNSIFEFTLSTSSYDYLNYYPQHDWSQYQKLRKCRDDSRHCIRNIPPCTEPTTSKSNSNKTVSDNPHGSLNSIPGDDFGDDGARNSDDPDDPDDEGPDDPIENPDNSNSSEHRIQINLADTITMLARNIQHQEDSSHSQV